MRSRSDWDSIGTVVGNASTSEFTFILKSFKSRVGDLVAVQMRIPDDSYLSTNETVVWGRIVGISRYNLFFPYEAAHELSQEGIPLIDTVLSNSRDQLEATVLILGCTSPESYSNINPLTYPVQPAASVFYPPAVVVQELLAGGYTRSYAVTNWHTYCAA